MLWGLGKKKARLLKLRVEIGDITVALNVLRDHKLGNSNAAITLLERKLAAKQEEHELSKELAPHMT